MIAFRKNELLFQNKLWQTFVSTGGSQSPKNGRVLITWLGVNYPTYYMASHQAVSTSRNKLQGRAIYNVLSELRFGTTQITEDLKDPVLMKIKFQIHQKVGRLSPHSKVSRLWLD